MKVTLVAFLFAASAFAQIPSAGHTTACGPDKVTFNVTVVENRYTPTQPEQGKALIYFIRDDGMWDVNQHLTLKIGLDGAWVGAFKGDSYFFVSVEPGEHHVCASVHSNFFAHFTAEPGKIYYFRTRFLMGISGAVLSYVDLDQPDSDEAQYLLSSYPLSVSTPKK